MAGPPGGGVTPPPLTPQAPPDGSISIDTTPVLPSALLSYLSTTAQTALLSASNIGTATTSQIETALENIQNLSNLTAYQIDASGLDSLADGATSSAFTVTDVGNSLFVRIIILIAEFQPTSGAKIVVSDGATAYEINVPTTLSEKRIEFNNLAADFVSSFTVTNSTGAAFPSYGNSIVVVPL